MPPRKKPASPAKRDAKRDDKKNEDKAAGAKAVTHAEGVTEVEGAEKRAADQNAAMIHGPRGDEAVKAEETEEPETGEPSPVVGASEKLPREEATDEQLEAREEAAINNASKFQPVLVPVGEQD